MNRGAKVIIDDDELRDDGSTVEKTLTPAERDRQRNAARQRIERLREEAALKHDLSDDF